MDPQLFLSLSSLAGLGYKQSPGRGSQNVLGIIPVTRVRTWLSQYVDVKLLLAEPLK